MICLEVHVNGKKLCTAGGEDLTAISVNVYSFVLEDGSNQLTLSIRGQTDENKAESVTWIRDALSIGDQIAVKIVEQANCDPPVRRTAERQT